MGDASRVDLVELFSSVQGEGPHVGTPALFVRLGGCDIRCVYCDEPRCTRSSGLSEKRTLPSRARD